MSSRYEVIILGEPTSPYIELPDSMLYGVGLTTGDNIRRSIRDGRLVLGHRLTTRVPIEPALLRRLGWQVGTRLAVEPAEVGEIVFEKVA